MIAAFLAGTWTALNADEHPRLMPGLHFRSSALLQRRLRCGN
jgi:hypothetical protein